MGAVLADGHGAPVAVAVLQGGSSVMFIFHRLLERPRTYLGLIILAVGADRLLRVSRHAGIAKEEKTMVKDLFRMVFGALTACVIAAIIAAGAIILIPTFSES